MERTALRLGVSEAQIRRDHLVSHILASLGTLDCDINVVFFGGTALCRTWCRDLRLSEDIDLIISDYPDAAGAIQEHVTLTVRREFPDLSWGPFDAWHDTLTTIASAGGLTVKVQFVKPRQREDRIPITPTAVSLTYSDLPIQVDLRVPTAEGFAAMKLMAWHQRQAGRDLYDLAALVQIGAITARSVALTKEIAGTRIGRVVLDQRIPASVLALWGDRLAHQLSVPLSAEECLASLLEALEVVDKI